MAISGFLWPCAIRPRISRSRSLSSGKISGGADSLALEKLYKRTWAASRVVRRDVVVVNGLYTGKKWLRATQDIPSRPQLDLEEIAEPGLPVLPSEVTLQLGEAIAAWRRAAEASDPLAAVIAIWEAIEFYAAGTKGDKLFSKSERRAVRARATEGMSGPKLRRVEQVLEKLNERSLMMKLRRALEEDSVPYREEEMELLT